MNDENKKLNGRKRPTTSLLFQFLFLLRFPNTSLEHTSLFHPFPYNPTLRLPTHLILKTQKLTYFHVFISL